MIPPFLFKASLLDKIDLKIDNNFFFVELKVALELAKSLDHHSPYSLPPTPGSSSSFSPGQQPGRRVVDGSTEVKKVVWFSLRTIKSSCSNSMANIRCRCTRAVI